jgi:hypothetical protein
MYLSFLFGLVLGVLSSAQLCSSYAITTTILLDLYQVTTTEAVYKAASPPAITQTAASSRGVYHLKPSATTTLIWSNTTSTVISIADASLLPFPLSSNQSAALFSLLSLVSSIPDNVLQAGNSSTHIFLSNVSSCLSNQTKAIEQVISLAVPALKNAATSIEGRLTSAVLPLATSLAGDFTSAVNPALTAAASAIENGAKGVASHASAILPAITSLAAPIENGAKAIGQDIGDFFQKKRQLADILQNRSELGAIANQLSTLDTCLSTAVDSNSIFQVGDCAFELAKLAFPLARIAKLKKLVGDVGGAERAVKTLVEAKSAAQAVTVGGSQVLDLIKEVSGVDDVVKACKFLI